MDAGKIFSRLSNPYVVLFVVFALVGFFAKPIARQAFKGRSEAAVARAGLVVKVVSVTLAAAMFVLFFIVSQ